MNASHSRNHFQGWATAVAVAACFGAAVTIRAAQPWPNRPVIHYAQADAAPPEPAGETAVLASESNTVELETSGTVSNGALKVRSRIRVGRNGSGQEPVVIFGSNYTLKSNETTEAVVIFGGNAKVEGKVTDAVVVFGGNANLTGAAGSLVVFGGQATVSGTVDDAVVVIGGNARVAPGAKVAGQVVTLGGSASISPEATVSGTVEQIGLRDLALKLPPWLRDWLTECAFKLRPLSLSVPWVWAFAGAFFLLYLLTAVALNRPVSACLRQFENSPATSFLVGLLGKLLFPFLVGLFAITGIGMLGIPFLLAALFLAVLIGKVALFQYLGGQVGRMTKSEAMQGRLLAFLVGWVLITLLYLVPVVGLIVMAVTSLWGFGAALMAMFSGTRRERPAAPPQPPVASPMPAYASPSFSGVVAPVMTPMADGSASAATTPLLTPAATPATPPDALVYPRAGFWLRMGAGLIDVILVGILTAFVSEILGRLIHGGPTFLWVSVAYFTALWMWKGTTVGGVVLNLRVARLDGQRISFAVALVRSLAAWFSVVVFFLGFFWIAWSNERQGWHDKITGTVVLRLPRGTPLLL